MCLRQHMSRRTTIQTPDARPGARRREESGLSDAELALCSHSCAIPSGRRQPSLNLAAAAAVVLAQCFELRSSPGCWPQLSSPAGGVSLS